MTLLILFAAALVISLSALVLMDPRIVAQWFSPDGALGAPTLEWLAIYRWIAAGLTLGLGIGVVGLLVARRRSPPTWRAAQLLGGRLLLSLAATTLTLLGGELALRGGWIEPGGSISDRADQGRFASDYLRSVEDQRNALRFRDREFEDPGPDPGPRVLFLGDSWVFGFGLRQAEEALPQRLEAELRRRGRPVRVYNAGRPGAGTVDQIRVARRLLKLLRPDVVLLGYHLNDAETAEDKARYFLSKRLLPLFSEQIGPSSRLWRLVEDRCGRLGLGLSYVEYLQGLYAEDSPSLARHRRELAELAALIEEHDARLAVVNFPALEQLADYPLEREHERVIGIFTELGLPCLDYLELFRGRDETELHVSRMDHHCNAEGVAEMVEPLVRFLDREDLLPR